MEPKVQAALGGTLFTAPWWGDVVSTVNATAATISLVTGAIVGLHGVYRIFRPRKK